MSNTIFWVKVYKKFVVAMIGFLGVLGAGFADGELTVSEGIAAAIAGLTALGVERARNADKDDRPVENV